MKIRIHHLSLLTLTGAFLVAGLQSASAVLSGIGWDGFPAAVNAAVPSNAANTNGGLSGTLNETGAGNASFNTGGDISTFYGNDSGVTPELPVPTATNNGYFEVASSVVFNIVNGSALQQTLIEVLVDLFVADRSQFLTVTASVNGGPSIGITGGQLNPTTGPGGNLWQQFGIMRNIVVPVGGTLVVTWTAGQGNRLAVDNVAYVFDSVPEPTNVLGLSALLGSVMVMRNRRRSA